MAADDNWKAGGSASGQGQPDPGPVKKPRKKSLDTQSLKVLAPRNEVARSALEMRQNLEKYLPPGPQRDKLIAQLKEDVTPLLSAELEKGEAEKTQSFDPADQEARLNEAIDRAARLIKGHLGQFETFGPVREVESVPIAVIEHLRSVLADPRRGRGEFQVAVGRKDKKLFSSSRFFVPNKMETFAYERQTAEGISDLQVSGYMITALIYVHQESDDKDAAHFLNADIEQADNLQALYPDIPVQIYLLTPSPESHLLIYSPNVKEKQPLGEVIGFFNINGNFDLRNASYTLAFKDAKLKIS